MIVDAMTAGIGASFAVRMATDDEPTIPKDAMLGVAAAGLLVALIYTASATSGARKYNACRAATASWRVREALRDRDAPAPGTDAPQAAVASQAYYCVRSPSRPYLEICGRNRDWCEHARQVMAIADSEACAPSDAVWCFGANDVERCFATASACEFHRGKVSSVAHECGEQR
ncbi:MAG TPA: hypothetical protein VHW23_44650 [Kofleriaceae bacterium]|nr:hypothetical protein [Kofleriaceae bacterium]